MNIEIIKNAKLASYFTLAPLFAYLGIAQEIFIIMTFAILADIVTGGIKAWVTKGFTSRSMKIGLFSRLFLLLIPISLAVMAKTISPDFRADLMVKMSLSVITLAEIYSTIGNIVSIREKDSTLTEQDAITRLLKQLLDWIDGIIDAITKTK